MGKVMFSPVSVCLSTPGGGGGGYPHPASGEGLPIQLTRGRGELVQVQMGGEGGYPIPGPDRGYPRVPSSRSGLRSGWGVPPCPGLDGGTPLPHPGLDGSTPPSPIQDWTGYPPLLSGDRVAGGMPLAFTQDNFFVFDYMSPASGFVTWLFLIVYCFIIKY